MDGPWWLRNAGYSSLHSSSETGSQITTSRSIQLAIFAILLIYPLYGYYQRRLSYQFDKAFGEQHGCLPMESRLPYKWPFALDILKLQYDALPSQRLLAFQSQYFDKVGQNMTFDLFGKTGYMTTDPKNIEAILCTYFEDYGMGSRRPGLFPLLGEGIFTQDGRPWKHSREMLRRQFARMNYQTMSAYDDPINRLVAELSSASGVVDLQPAFFRFTLTTTTALIFGEAVGGLDDDDQDTFSKSFDYASYICAIRLRLADFCWAYSPSEFRRSCATVKRYANHFVQRPLKDVEENGEDEARKRHLFILNLYKELQDPGMVCDQLVNILIAGRDTTACLLSWAFYCLVRHPDVLQLLRREIQSMTESPQGMTRAQILKLPYLKCVLNETLRLYPQLPVNVRVATKTTMLPRGGGPDGQSPVLIPRGTGIGYSVYHMHRHTSLYGADAAAFNPARWEDSKLARIGPGLCRSMPDRESVSGDFALTEAPFTIVRLIQAFPNLRLPPDASTDPIGQERQSLTIVVSSADGCKVLL